MKIKNSTKENKKTMLVTSQAEKSLIYLKFKVMKMSIQKRYGGGETLLYFLFLSLEKN